MSTIVISSGHGKHIRGASGIIDEVDEARKVVDQLAYVLKQRGVSVYTFHDNTSYDQSTNLETIVNYHNSKSRELDISVHFNAYVETTKPMGCEVLYVTQPDLAERVSAAIASVGFTDRGPKYRDDLYFLNQTEMPAILLEINFVDSQADCDLYRSQFNAIVNAIADALQKDTVSAEPAVHIETTGRVRVFLNGRRLS